MAVDRCDLTILKGRIIAAVNAAPAGTWATTLNLSDDNRRNDTELEKAALGGDAQVCSAICESADNGDRSLFTTETAVVHGIKIERIGPVGKPLIQAYAGAAYIRGVEMSADMIGSYRANLNQLYDTIAHDQEGSSLGGYYDFDPISNVFSFTGLNAKLELARFLKTGACQSPVRYEDTVLGLALLNLPKEGDTAPFLAIIGQQSLTHIQMIKAGSMTVPPLEIPRLAQAAGG